MDRIMNSIKDEAIIGGGKKRLDHPKSDGISFENYEPSKLKDEPSMNQLNSESVKPAAGYQPVNDTNELTLKACRQRQMASDIFGVGMDKAWTSAPETGLVEQVTNDEPTPLDLSPTESSPNDCVDQAVENVSEEVKTPDEVLISSDDIEKPAEVQGQQEGGQDFEEKVVKTGKRHFEGKNEITHFW